MAPAGRRGNGGRVPGPRAARHRRRGGAHDAAHPRQAGHDLQAVEQGDGAQPERGRPPGNRRARQWQRRGQPP